MNNGKMVRWSNQDSSKVLRWGHPPIRPSLSRRKASPLLVFFFFLNQFCVCRSSRRRPVVRALVFNGFHAVPWAGVVHSGRVRISHPSGSRRAGEPRKPAGSPWLLRAPENPRCPDRVQLPRPGDPGGGQSPWLWLPEPPQPFNGSRPRRTRNPPTHERRLCHPSSAAPLAWLATRSAPVS